MWDSTKPQSGAITYPDAQQLVLELRSRAEIRQWIARLIKRRVERVGLHIRAYLIAMR